MNNKMRELLIRSVLILAWICGIGLFLYVPYWLRAERSINILVQPSVIDAEYLVNFEKETGIKVYISYFESSDELVVKLRATEGKDYDLVMPPVYATEILIKEKLLKKLDRAQLNFFHQLYPVLMNKYFDPDNQYTIPIFWAIYGLGVNKNYWDGQLPSATWGLLFDEKIAPHCVIMADGARELVLVAAQYLFGEIENLTAEQIKKIAQLLHKQRPWVQMYNDLRVEFLLASNVCPVGMISSADLAKILPRYKNIDFIVPKEGGFAWIDSFGIPIGSTKEELIYQFLNYIYTPEVLQKYVDKYKFFPPVKNVQPADQLKNLSIPTEEMFEKLAFFKDIVDDHVLSELFIALKA